MVADVKSKRNLFFDCSKGLALFVIVIIHSLLLPAFRTPLSFFMNSFFFFFAGFMFKPDSIQSFSDFFNYFKKLLKRYAKPYIIGNLSYLFLYNLFIKYHLITYDNRFHVPVHYLSAKEMFIRALQHIFMISHSEFLSGAIWFLKNLFWGLLIFSIITLIYNLCIKNLKFRIGRYYIYIFIVVILYIVSLFYNSKSFLSLFCTLVIMFTADYFRQYFKYIKCNIYWLLFSVIFLAVSLLIYKPYSKVLSFILVSVGIFVCLYEISFFLKKFNSLYNFFVYLGQNTIPVMILHVFCYKIISYVYIMVYSLPKEFLGTYPLFLYPDNPYICICWQFIYAAVGIITPLLLNELYKKFKSVICK